ncbi:molybdopterin containing oxidoreductase [Adhaeribacter aerolatus]|uniref:Molybdopterin containing oxidoreductase n=1 Tax=Adhaeribacter aerolatus TaxID=670289 RepID=A0A512AS58_9BACT|nr:sulfite oxidase [Adhaeribacter aerolatus]GEO02544.1 molybdopterin containing oxidoreductase [Adhaeribacter aerolatus]
MANDEVKKSRRQFLLKSGLGLVGLALGNNFLVKGSVAINTESRKLTLGDGFSLKEKHPDLVVLSDKPWNIETPPHLLDDAITPANKLFVRNNGLIPENIDAKTWTLTIDGESVEKQTVFTLDDLKKKFKHHTYQLVHECAGNGRAEYNPPGHGNQWTTGGVGCCEWTGVRLRDVLEAAGIKKDAVYIGYYGRDKHLSGKDEVPISRGVPMRKALEEEALVAWAMNGQDIPVVHGYPLRLIFGGWPASTSGKWLTRISIRNKIHDGAKMNGADYRLPKNTIAPGAKITATNENMRIIEAMPVKSLITYPKTGAQLPEGKMLELRGHAWAGDRKIKEMHISYNFGATWQKCSIKGPRNRNCWQQWTTQVKLPQKGYFEVWARATDSEGVMQPMLVPAWNPGGYLNNACHRIAVEVV